jgi:predicted ATPase
VPALRAARFDKPPGAKAFPWTVPVVRGLRSIEFDAPITLFVGENGAGKSTLLEALAIATRSVALGSSDLASDATLAGSRDLARRTTISYEGKLPITRLFVRAEDVFGFVKRVTEQMADLRRMERSYLDGDEPPDPDSGRARAAGSMRGQRAALEARYGDAPDARSHGETFLDFLQQRIVPKGLYFFDEPETPLSPTRILALIAMLRDAVEEGSQFIIATHSPILMATPGADVRLIEDGTMRSVPFDEVEHVRVTRDFLNAPERYLRHLS